MFTISHMEDQTIFNKQHGPARWLGLVPTAKPSASGFDSVGGRMTERIEKRKIEEIVCYDRNPRKNNKAVEHVLESLRRHGQVKPLVLSAAGFPFDRETLCCGHTTLKALKKFGASEALVVVKQFDSEAEFADYNIRDNRAGEFASWDEAGLAKLAGDFEIDLADMGFDFDLGQDGGNSDEDALPEVNEDPTAKLGQIWKLGHHRLMCGDSTSRGDVERLMAGEKADMVFTDPPYGINYSKDQTGRDRARGKKSGRVKYEIKNDSIELTPFLIKAFKNIDFATKENWSGYLFYSDDKEIENITALKDANIFVSQRLIWVKNNHTLSFYKYQYKHEPFLFIGPNSKVKPNGHWYGGFQTTVWDFAKEIKVIHPTQKPVELIKEAISHVTKSNELLYEPFSGSGSTLIASEKTGRRCYGMELDPHYCEVIIKRWEDYAGEKAELVDG